MQYVTDEGRGASARYPAQETPLGRNFKFMVVRSKACVRFGFYSHMSICVVVEARQLQKAVRVGRNCVANANLERARSVLQPAVRLSDPLAWPTLPPRLAPPRRGDGATCGRCRPEIDGSPKEAILATAHRRCG